MSEIWKDIPNCWPYQASSFGRIKRLGVPDARGWCIKERVLKLIPRNDGYFQVTLVVDRKRADWLVHRLILLTFKGASPEPRLLALHDDDIKSNNVPANLYWGTHADNMDDAIRHGIHGKDSPTALKVSAKLKGRISPTLGMKFGPETSARHRAARLGKKRGPYRKATT